MRGGAQQPLPCWAHVWATLGFATKLPGEKCRGEWNADDVGVKFNPGCVSAHEKLTPMPMVNNAMASAPAAVTKGFATAV
jgi:hypothetical protein